MNIENNYNPNREDKIVQRDREMASLSTINRHHTVLLSNNRKRSDQIINRHYRRMWGFQVN